MSVTLWRWEEYAPDFGNNREVPRAEQFRLRVKAGISKARFTRFLEEKERTSADDWDAALSDLVEVAQPVTLDGVEVKTLKDYLSIALEQRNGQMLLELVGAVTYFNSIAGARSFGSGRASGGGSSMSRSPGKTDEDESSDSLDGSGTSH